MKSQEKIKLILDITPLKNGYFYDASRSGIFFVVKNILLVLLERDDVELYFYISRNEPDSRMKTDWVIGKEFPGHADRIRSRILDRWLWRDHILKKLSALREHFSNRPVWLFPVRTLLWLCRKIMPYFPVPENELPTDLCKNGVFLSLMYAIPSRIKQQIPPRRCYTLLHDAMQSFRGGEMDLWYRELTQSLSANENYFAVSGSTARDFCRLFPVLTGKTIPVVPLAAAGNFQPISAAEERQKLRKKYQIPPDRKIFYSHCSFSENKNLERQLAAFCRLYRENQQWCMIFSGGDKNNRIQTMLQQLREAEIPEHAVRFTGYADDADLPGLYSLADIFCFVSLYEGFGLPVLEAMSCGCPVLTSRSSSLPEVAGDAALLVDPEDENDIFEGMKKLADDLSLRQELIRKGLARAALFSWNSTAERILAEISAH